MRIRRSSFLAVILVLGVLVPSAAAGPGKRPSFSVSEMREWLGYLASDELEGRATFSEGLGLAAGYIAERLREWGVKPAGENGTYFQRVVVQTVQAEPRSTVTVEANGQSRTFRLGEGIELPANVGIKRSFTADQVEFLGYGLHAPAEGFDDYAGRDVRGKVVVWLGPQGPSALKNAGFRVLGRRDRVALDGGAVAVIGPGRPARRPGASGTEFTGVERIDRPMAPSVTASDAFFEHLFAGQEAAYADLKSKAASREPLPRFTLKNVKITFDLDSNYKIARTRYTRNVVGIVEGRDRGLRPTYVAFGAHYDHVGYAEGPVGETALGRRVSDPKGVIGTGAGEDRIWNGADDDASGTVAILAVAKAFAQGPRPRRSLLFVWHTGEESGLWGSKWFVENPPVPLESIIAQINLDMVGRNRDNKTEEARTVYAIGADRISTALHNLTVDANTSLKQPLTLSFEMNDPADPQSLYTRSDHYSYAQKGIPVVFFTTHLHPDYHANTDHADRIHYDKMSQVVELAHRLGMLVADQRTPLVRDNKGPRAGKGSSGRLPL